MGSGEHFAASETVQDLGHLRENETYERIAREHLHRLFAAAQLRSLSHCAEVLGVDVNAVEHWFAGGDEHTEIPGWVLVRLAELAKEPASFFACDH